MPADANVLPPAVEVSDQAVAAEESLQQTDDMAAETGIALEPDQGPRSDRKPCRVRFWVGYAHAARCVAGYTRMYASSD